MVIPLSMTGSLITLLVSASGSLGLLTIGLFAAFGLSAIFFCRFSLRARVRSNSFCLDKQKTEAGQTEFWELLLQYKLKPQKFTQITELTVLTCYLIICTYVLFIAGPLDWFILLHRHCFYCVHPSVQQKCCYSNQGFFKQSDNVFSVHSPTAGEMSIPLQ